VKEARVEFMAMSPWPALVRPTACTSRTVGHYTVVSATSRVDRFSYSSYDLYQKVCPARDYDDDDPLRPNFPI
jgi:hypothetical protein